jgi:hypothetical protein
MELPPFPHATRYDREKVEALLEAARRRVDASEMANRPRCEVGPRFLDLGAVPFGLPVEVAVLIDNVGPVEAAFYFVAPPRPHGASGGGGGGRVVTWDDEQPLAPEWLELTPEEGVVEAGGRPS